MVRNIRALAVAAALGASALTAGAAQAGKPIPEAGMTLDEIGVWLKARGLEVTKIDPSVSLVAAKLKDQKVAVFGLDCKDGRCRSLQYYYGIRYQNGVRPDEASALGVVNTWNKKYRWVKAWTDDERNPGIEMDVSLSPGGDTDALNASLETFEGAISLFRSYLTPKT
jgi:hypothetical protein